MIGGDTIEGDTGADITWLRPNDCSRTSCATKSGESLLSLAARYDISPQTVVKWQKRIFVEDAPMGPKDLRSTDLDLFFNIFWD